MPPTPESSPPTTPDYIRPLSVPDSIEETPLHADTPVTDHTADTAVEPPIQMYEQRNGRPYLVDKLELQNVWKQMGLEDDARAIDAYVLTEIGNRDLKPDKYTYDQIVSDLEGRLGVEPNLNFDVLITRLGAYVKMLTEVELKEKLKKYYDHI